MSKVLAVVVELRSNADTMRIAEQVTTGIDPVLPDAVSRRGIGQALAPLEPGVHANKGQGQEDLCKAAGAHRVAIATRQKVEDR